MSRLKSELAAHEKYYQFRFGTATASVKDVREKMLKNNELMLQYFVGDSTLFVFLIGKERYEVRVIPNDFDIRGKVRDFRWGITGYYEASVSDTSLFRQSLSAYETNSLDLYRRLVAPLDLSPQDSTLIIVPDGDLWLVPFEALLTQAPEMSGDFNSYPYLLHRHNISYAYSATLLREAKSKPHRVSPQKTLWACAPFDKQYAEMRQASVYRFSELPESAWEVQAAKQTLGGDILIGPEAVKNRFLESLNTYRIVLFSTHAKADEEGYIAFFPAEGMPEKQNLLFTKEVYNLELNAQLVIFSACESGLGILRPGEGMISLARAFTYAGAHGLMTTLWEMNDFSGSRINVSVCNQLKSKLPAHHALCSAKREWLENCSSQEAHPWFWAGTIALGYFGEKDK
ncbi:MAG: CHAT domain-containing protein [Saprospiraceae bacterium]|nr:CHAT domain-containing protein [Saprospiraceae bacterium]